MRVHRWWQFAAAMAAAAIIAGLSVGTGPVDAVRHRPHGRQVLRWPGWRVAGGAGPYWIAPAALAVAHEGQVIDEDPVTAQRVTVASVRSDTPGGSVVIASEMAGLVEHEVDGDTRPGLRPGHPLQLDRVAGRVS